MVVTPSREHAIRLYQAVRAYTERCGYTDCAALVAFSGSKTLGEIEYTESKLNGFPESESPTRFANTRLDDPKPPSLPRPEYRILVVADKYQTGFDQPLLTTMYVRRQATGRTGGRADPVPPQPYPPPQVRGGPVRPGLRQQAMSWAIRSWTAAVLSCCSRS
jgi:hypothetical protein